jgi:hypothetical protein
MGERYCEVAKQIPCPIQNAPFAFWVGDYEL